MTVFFFISPKEKVVHQIPNKALVSPETLHCPVRSSSPSALALCAALIDGRECDSEEVNTKDRVKIKSAALDTATGSRYSFWDH